MTTTRDEVIGLESGKIEPVGHFQKIDLDIGGSCVLKILN